MSHPDPTKEYIEIIECEKCGDHIGEKMIGDEIYAYCKECNWVTNN